MQADMTNEEDKATIRDDDDVGTHLFWVKQMWRVAMAIGPEQTRKELLEYLCERIAQSLTQPDAVCTWLCCSPCSLHAAGTA